MIAQDGLHLRQRNTRPLEDDAGPNARGRDGPCAGAPRPGVFQSGDSRWAGEFFENLQVLAETAAGEELLTTWMDADRFWAMLADRRDTEFMAEIAARVEPWRALSLAQIYFDFHVLGPATAAALTRAAQAPVGAPVS